MRKMTNQQLIYTYKKVKKNLMENEQSKDFNHVADNETEKLIEWMVKKELRARGVKLNSLDTK